MKQNFKQLFAVGYLYKYAWYHTIWQRYFRCVDSKMLDSDASEISCLAPIADFFASTWTSVNNNFDNKSEKISERKVN